MKVRHVRQRLRNVPVLSLAWSMTTSNMSIGKRGSEDIEVGVVSVALQEGQDSVVVVVGVILKMGGRGVLTAPEQRGASKLHVPY